MTLSQDILAELAEITPGSPLYQARRPRCRHPSRPGKL